MDRPVTVAPFCLDLREVTVSEYRSCVQAGHCNDSQLDCSEDEANYPAADRADHPINCVSWEQAVAYCSAQRKRLPREEEWEWAARGGEQDRTYPWGEASPESQLCWRRNEGTCGVGSFPEGNGRWDLQDLAGNLSEWTTSLAHSQGTDRVLRGSRWADGEERLVRVAGNLFGRSSREFGMESGHGSGNGIRCAANP